MIPNVSIMDTQQRLRKSQNSYQVTLALWPILWYGRLLGMIPISKSRVNELTFSYSSIPWAFAMYSWSSYFIIFLFAVIIFVRDVSGDSDLSLMEQFLDMVYHYHITAIMSICIYQSRFLPEVVQHLCTLEDKINDLESHCSLESRTPEIASLTFTPYKKAVMAEFTDKVGKSINTETYGRFPVTVNYEEYESNCQKTLFKRQHSWLVYYCWMLTLTYFCLAGIGAVSYFVGIGVRNNVTSAEEYFNEVSKVYIIEELSDWWTGIYVVFIGFINKAKHVIISFVYLIHLIITANTLSGPGHLMELTWNYGDLLIVVFSIILRHQYCRFNRMMTTLTRCIHSSSDIEQCRQLHWDIAFVVKKTNRVLGVITSTTFVCNILYLFSRVYLGLSSDLSSSNALIVFEALYAFIYLICRMFATAYFAGRLNSESLLTLVIISEFPFRGQSENYYIMIDRFYNQVLSANIAISGNGYFILNRNFITTLASALITYEVIILQFSASSK